MIKYAQLAILEAKAGKENLEEEFLKPALPLVEAEPNTVSWDAFKLDANKFGIFDTFNNEDGRKIHLKGEVATTLIAKAPALFTTAPQIQQVEVLAVK